MKNNEVKAINIYNIIKALKPSCVSLSVNNYLAILSFISDIILTKYSQYNSTGARYYLNKLDDNHILINLNKPYNIDDNIIWSEPININWNIDYINKFLNMKMYW